MAIFRSFATAFLIWCFSLIDLAVAILPRQSTTASTGAPVVKVLNGSYQGIELPTWNQDAFLGIPYAQPPLGNLRFRWPQSLNSTWTGVRDATEYGFSCYQYGSTFNLSEDCLTLNVVRPTGTKASDSLPVLLWIYGGGLTSGSSADPQYNVSGILNVAQRIGQPMITISINYRLGLWGFLSSTQLLDEGSLNAGLLDQRMAFRWVQDNIAAFGGDPKKVTIWGESAGAQSIGLHLSSYGGRNDGLFRGCIMESGGPIGTSLQTLAYYASPFENLTRTVGCWAASDRIGCLRNLTSEELFTTQYTEVWNPLVDGDFLTDYPSTLLPQGHFIKVPILIGANSDEGSSFSITGQNSTQGLYNAFFTWRNYALTPYSISYLMQLYSEHAPQWGYPPYAVPWQETFPSKGLEWRLSAAIGGDMVMNAQRRWMAQLYSAEPALHNKVYSYRFDQAPWGAPVSEGVEHFVNVAFSFQNISGNLGAAAPPSYAQLAERIGVAYAGFVVQQDLNAFVARAKASSGDRLAGFPDWPSYTNGPANMVMNATASYVEADTWRTEGIEFLQSIFRQVQA